MQTEALSNPNWILSPGQGKELLNSPFPKGNLVAEVEESEATFIEPLTDRRSIVTDFLIPMKGASLKTLGRASESQG